MKQISLSHGQIAFVDDDDFEKLSNFSWVAEMRRDGKVIAVTKVKGKKIRMHRMITNCPQGMVVDHINHDTLFNLKSNLRVCTRNENNWNRRIVTKNNFKGVDYDPMRKKPYRARIRANNQRYFSKAFSTEEEAARAYDEMAARLHGQFACLNFPSMEVLMKLS